MWTFCFIYSQEGRLPGTVRFTPARSTSGLFIAKIRKAASANDESRAE